MKAWLYLVDVTLENGPFKYVKGWSKLTWARVKWEYRKSLSTARGGSGGAFRATDEDFSELGYNQAEAVQVPRNTLVIVNTYGLYCRGAADGMRTRIEVWAHSRVNPFNPFPGLSAQFIEKIRHNMIDRFTLRQKKLGKLNVVQANWSSDFKRESK